MPYERSFQGLSKTCILSLLSIPETEKYAVGRANAENKHERRVMLSDTKHHNAGKKRIIVRNQTTLSARNTIEQRSDAVNYTTSRDWNTKRE